MADDVRTASEGAPGEDTQTQLFTTVFLTEAETEVFDAEDLFTTLSLASAGLPRGGRDDRLYGVLGGMPTRSRTVVDTAARILVAGGALLAVGLALRLLPTVAGALLYAVVRLVGVL